MTYVPKYPDQFVVDAIEGARKREQAARDRHRAKRGLSPDYEPPRKRAVSGTNAAPPQQWPTLPHSAPDEWALARVHSQIYGLLMAHAPISVDRLTDILGRRRSSVEVYLSELRVAGRRYGIVIPYVTDNVIYRPSLRSEPQ